MHQDTCLAEHPSARVSVVTTRFSIAVVALALAVLVVVSLGQGAPVEPADTSVGALEDWHGNVMRSR
ncbi:hypothetical protein [Roseovarius sp.]|uniref:hypothetical protein n=1 Tax=Roseovarius sp. TaxID=1486281 RepID=UPI0025E40505|nr:hypothetical protein [Roseovarius sp.]